MGRFGRLEPGDAPEEVVQEVLEDPDALTYQFVVRAVPDDADHAITAMREQFEQRLDEALRAIAQTDQRIAEADRRVAEEQERAEQVRAELQRELTAMHEQVVARDQELASLRADLAALQATKVMRATRTARAIYGMARGTGGA